MKEIQDLENYIEALVNIPEIDEKVIAEFQNIQLLLEVYKAGLNQKQFPITEFFSKFELKNTPEQFHTLLGQMALLKSKTADGRVLEYLFNSTENILRDFKNYFKFRGF